MSEAKSIAPPFGLERVSSWLNDFLDSPLLLDGLVQNCSVRLGESFVVPKEYLNHNTAECRNTLQRSLCVFVVMQSIVDAAGGLNNAFEVLRVLKK